MYIDREYPNDRQEFLSRPPGKYNDDLDGRGARRKRDRSDRPINWATGKILLRHSDVIRIIFYSYIGVRGFVLFNR